MEVIHHEQADTHVVMGGKKVRSFGISNNATFITMLSEGLYSNKNLAVVREVMCNGWDIHINTKREATPMVVTLTESKMTFRDFGTGIHDDLMEEIYCVYGNSTKAHNGEENGGFGLGSKAPFAYSTHFTVTSYHKGIKTVYGISRGSLETDNKPDIRTMVSVPTTEEGLEVSIPLAQEGDRREFTRLIKAIAYFGQMNVELNGEVLDKLDHDFDKAHACLVKADDGHVRNLQMEGTMYVRYGTVVYPLTIDDFYSSEYKELAQFIPKEKSSYSRSHRAMIILQAEPNTISVTPTRETLSYTSRTKESIRLLLTKAVSGIAAYKEEAFAQMTEKVIKTYAAQTSTPNKNVIEILTKSSPTATYRDNNPVFTSDETTYSTILQNYLYDSNAVTKKGTDFYIPREQRDVVVHATVRKYYPQLNSFWDLLFADVKTLNHKYEAMMCLNWHYYFELEEAIGKDNMVYFYRSAEFHHGKYKKLTTTKELTEAFENDVYNFSRYEVGYSQKAIHENTNSTTRADFSFIPSRKKGVAEEIKDALTANGYSYEDHLEKTVYVKPDPEAPKRPKGYTLLSATLDQFGNYKSGLLGDYTIARNDQPAPIFSEVSYNRERVVDGFRAVKPTVLTTLLPDAVIVSSSTTASKAVADKGMVDGAKAIWEKVQTVIDRIPTFYERYYLSTFMDSSTFKLLVKLSEYDTAVNQYIGFSPITDPEHLAVLELLSSYDNDFYRSGDDPATRTFVREFRKTKREKQVDNTIIKKVTSNVLLGSLDLDYIYDSVRNQTEQCDDLLALLHLTL